MVLDYLAPLMMSMSLDHILANYFLVKIIKFFFRKIKKVFYKKICNLSDFFYPQDYFINWNKIYGKKGFFEVQFLVKERDFVDVLNRISAFFV